MKYTTQYDSDHGICTVSVTGKHKRPGDSVLLQQFARDFGKEHGCNRFLFDMTQAKIVGTTLDTLQAGTVPADTDKKQESQQIALVYARDLDEHKFLENVAVNRGYNVRIFDHIEKAMDWLISKENKPI